MAFNPDSTSYSDEKTISYFNALGNRARQQKSGEPASVIIIDAERTIKTVSLRDAVTTIGKAGDIKVVSQIVSREQGCFSRKDGEYYYTDEGSTNGSELNGKQICNPLGTKSNSYCLGEGDIIRIMVPGDPANIENVLIIFSRQSTSSLGKWQYIDLRKQGGSLEIGRSVSDTKGLRIDSMQASKKHASVFPTENGYTIVDENSLNGIIVNGNRVIGSRKLSDFDVICIANIKIIYLNGYLVFNTVPTGVKLEIKDISKVVGHTNRLILDHISLTVNPSELVAVIGGSGAGKTTFMNCVNGYEPATSGQILLDGMDLIKNYHTLKSRIGNVPQSDELYDYLTVYKFLMFTAELRLARDISRNERENRVRKVIEIMGLDEHQKKVIKKLSGGQKKRVSIAMELVSDPDIFFLDEPTSGLDPETETLLMNQLKNLTVNFSKTIVVITHTLQNIHLFDKIIFLAPGGKLCFYGTPAAALDFFDVHTISEAYEKVKKSPSHFVNKYKNFRKG